MQQPGTYTLFCQYDEQKWLMCLIFTYEGPQRRLLFGPLYSPVRLPCSTLELPGVFFPLHHRLPGTGGHLLRGALAVISSAETW